MDIFLFRSLRISIDFFDNSGGDEGSNASPNILRLEFFLSFDFDLSSCRNLRSFSFCTALTISFTISPNGREEWIPILSDRIGEYLSMFFYLFCAK